MPLSVCMKIEVHFGFTFTVVLLLNVSPPLPVAFSVYVPYVDGSSVGIYTDQGTALQRHQRTDSI